MWTERERKVSRIAQVYSQTFSTSGFFSRMAQTLPLLVLAVLNSLSCHSEVRARDPDVEEEEAVGLGERAQQMPGAFGTDHLPTHDHRHHSITDSMAPVGAPQNSVNPLRERLHPPAHRG